MGHFALTSLFVSFSLSQFLSHFKYLWDSFIGRTLDLDLWENAGTAGRD